MGKEFNINIKINAIDGFSDTFNKVNSAVSGMAKMAKSSGGMSNSMNKASKAGGKFFDLAAPQMLQQTGQQIESIGASLTSLGMKAYESTASLQEARNMLETVGLQGDSLKRVEDAARKVGGEYAMVTSDILSASYDLQSGMSFLNDVDGPEKAGESLGKMAEIAIKTAKGTGASVNTMTNVLATAGNAWGKQFQGNKEQFLAWGETFGDVFSKTIELAQTTGPAMGTYIKKLEGSLNSLGNTTMEQQLAFGGFFQTQGLSASSAATAVKNMAGAWTKTAMPAIKGLGIQTMNSDGSLRSMVDVLRDFEKEFSGMTVLQQEDFLRKAFVDKKSIGAVKMLMQDFQSFDNLQKTLSKNSAGAMQTMADKTTKGAKFAMERNKVAVQNMWETIGQATEESTAGVVNFKTQVVDMVTKFTQANPKIVGALNSVAQVAGTALQGLGGVMKNVGFIQQGISGLGQMRQSLGKMWNSMSKGTKIMGGVALGIGAIVGILASTPEGMEMLKEIGQTLKEAIAPLMPVLKDLGSKVMEAIRPVLPLLADLVKQLVEGLAPILPILVEAITPIITILADVLADIIPVIMDVVKVVLEALEPALAAIMPMIQMVGQVLAMLMPILTPIIKLIAELFGALMKMQAAIAGLVMGIIKEIMYNIPDFLLPFEAEIGKYKAMAEDESLDMETRTEAARKHLEKAAINEDASMTERYKAVEELKAAGLSVPQEAIDRLNDQMKNATEEEKAALGNVKVRTMNEVMGIKDGAEGVIKNESQKVITNVTPKANSYNNIASNISPALAANTSYKTQDINSKVEAPVNITIQGNATPEAIDKAKSEFSTLQTKQAADIERQLNTRISIAQVANG